MRIKVKVKNVVVEVRIPLARLILFVHQASAPQGFLKHFGL